MEALGRAAIAMFCWRGLFTLPHAGSVSPIELCRLAPGTLYSPLDLSYSPDARRSYRVERSRSKASGPWEGSWSSERENSLSGLRQEAL